jgi:hypothetical protein
MLLKHKEEYRFTLPIYPHVLGYLITSGMLLKHKEKEIT